VLERYTDLDDDTQEAIEDISLRAARLWIDFGTQRCRFVVIMVGSLLTTSSERVQLAIDPEMKLNLNLKPELWQHGEGPGHTLEKKQRISDGVVESL
jgi:hypothetical protein